MRKRLMGISSRTKPIRTFFKVRLEDRLQYQQTRRLHHPISYRRDSQRQLPPLRLINVDAPYRLGLVGLGQKLLKFPFSLCLRKLQLSPSGTFIQAAFPLSSISMLHRRFQPSSFFGRLATLIERNEAENRFACATARLFALQGFASGIAPTHACSATCQTANLQDILLSEY